MGELLELGAEFAGKITASYLAALPERLQTLVDERSAGTAEGIRAAAGMAHLLCGSSGSLGAPRMAQLCRSLEHALTDGRLDDADRLMEQVRQHAGPLTRAMRSLLVQPLQ
jgi:HPt (histidine-containing phosphotransfer) domain-containing protein